MTVKTTFVVSAPFEAARHLHHLPAGHKSRSTHGHSFWGSVQCALPKGLAAYPGGEVETIKAQLMPLVDQLDYSLLNERLESPGDESIARWLRMHCQLPGIESSAIQSTRNQGVTSDADGTARLWRRYDFQAAHKLPHVAAGHKCGNMHGHGFAVVLHASRTPGSSDVCLDYDRLDSVWLPVFELLDHACLNDIEGLHNPTSELISQWIWSKIKPVCDELACVSVFETASCGAHYNGETFEIWKDFTLDSSVKFRHAPEGSKKTRLHGYTYTMRLHLSAPLDQVMGWAIDFGDVKELFNPVFKQIDHQPLWENTEIEDCDVATLAQYIFKKSRVALPQVSKLELYETRGCGAICASNSFSPNLPI